MNNDLSEYHQDFYAWSKHNANLLRQGKLSEIHEVLLVIRFDNICSWLPLIKSPLAPLFQRGEFLI